MWFGGQEVLPTAICKLETREATDKIQPELEGLSVSPSLSLKARQPEAQMLMSEEKMGISQRSTVSKFTLPLPFLC